MLPFHQGFRPLSIAPVELAHEVAWINHVKWRKVDLLNLQPWHLEMLDFELGIDRDDPTGDEIQRTHLFHLVGSQWERAPVDTGAQSPLQRELSDAWTRVWFGRQRLRQREHGKFFDDTNIRSTKVALELARRVSAKRFIMMSADDSLDGPCLPGDNTAAAVRLAGPGFVSSKREAEALVRRAAGWDDDDADADGDASASSSSRKRTTTSQLLGEDGWPCATACLRPSCVYGSERPLGTALARVGKPLGKAGALPAASPLRRALPVSVVARCLAELTGSVLAIDRHSVLDWRDIQACADQAASFSVPDD